MNQHEADVLSNYLEERFSLGSSIERVENDKGQPDFRVVIPMPAVDFHVTTAANIPRIIDDMEALLGLLKG